MRDFETFRNNFNGENSICSINQSISRLHHHGFPVMYGLYPCDPNLLDPVLRLVFCDEDVAELELVITPYGPKAGRDDRAFC